MKNIAIFASGEGTNTQALIDHFSKSSHIQVKMVVSNKVTSPVLLKAMKGNIPIMVLNKKEYFSVSQFIEILQKEKIDLIVLAGFIMLLPPNLIEPFKGKIINIHPALLPKYGGKGMYGSRVFEEVIKNKEKESGITIHYVNEHFDQGEIIFQSKFEVTPEDTVETLTEKTHQLEYKYYPEVIEDLLRA